MRDLNMNPFIFTLLLVHGTAIRAPSIGSYYE